MLLLTSLQGWLMVAVIALKMHNAAEVLAELKRLHNLGLTGSFLAICSGLALILLEPRAVRRTAICRVLLPSLLVAPVAFCDRILTLLLGSIPALGQAGFYGLQAISAFGITVALLMLVLSLVARARWEGAAPSKES
jgi:hypothetical protein